MSNKLTALQAHFVANAACANQYQEYVADLHRSIKRIAQSGLYTTSVRVKSCYTNRGLDLLTYFGGYGYTVGLKHGVLTLSW